METTNYETQNTGRVRSTFLTVICVLTFIGSGWGIGKAAYNYVKADSIASETAAGMEKLQDKMDDKDSPGFAKGMLSSISANLNPASIRESEIFDLISCLLTLGGAIMMWNLKKAGFYLYIAGTIILVIAPMIMLGKGVMGLAAGGVTALIGVAFIAMYGANLKDMTG